MRFAHPGFLVYKPVPDSYSKTSSNQKEMCMHRAIDTAV